MKIPFLKFLRLLIIVVFSLAPALLFSDENIQEIRSQYLRLISRGEYDKAITTVKALLENHPQNDIFLYDLANIYFLGTAQFDEAEEYFKKVIQVNPQNHFVYTSLGYLYEKKENLTEALQCYRKAVDIAPDEEWTDFAKSHITAIDLIQKKELVKDWLLLGPIPKDPHMKDPDFIFREEPVIAGKNVQISNKEYRWIRPYPSEKFGFVSMNDLFKPNDFVSAYALNYVYSVEDTSALILFGSDDGAKIWVNSKPIGERFAGGAVLVDFHTIPVFLHAGWNKIIVQVFDEWGDWGFYFRIRSSHGESLKIVFSPNRDPRVLAPFQTAILEHIIRRVLSICGLVLILGFFGLGGCFIIRKGIELNKLKNLFFDGISHELRTPLTSIKACTDTLVLGRASPEEEKEYLQYIQNETSRLETIVENLLHFSKLQKDKRAKLRLESYDLGKVLNKTADIFKNQMRDPELKLTLAIPAEPVYCFLDENLFTQALLNLLQNAYKYSREKKIVEIKLERNDSQIIISIKDQGCGIPKKEFKNIFKPFYRVGESGKKGVGLGLALTAVILRKHHGQIKIESIEGQGSTFFIFLKEVPH